MTGAKDTRTDEDDCGIDWMKEQHTLAQEASDGVHWLDAGSDNALPGGEMQDDVW